MRDIINEVFFAVAGFMLITAPFMENSLNYWLLFSLGLVFILALILTYFVSDRFDAQFRSVFLNDKNLDTKLPLAFLPARWYLSFRVTRACMYGRNILIAKGTKKNWIQESWFHGYNFREHARTIDVIVTYLFFISLAFFMFFALILGVLQIFGVST